MLEFIECKAKEEKKARILIEHGYDSNFNGEAYSSILFQNANLSVRVTDDFMQAVVEDKPWTTHWVTDPDKAGPTYQARDLLDKMAEGAWHCGDPGVQYDTTINRWNTCPNSGRINASNPCSEYMFLDNTACNLASINLMKFRQADGTFDVERFQAACRIFFIAQEILVDHASYPTQADRREQPSVPPAGSGLLEPRQPDHVQRPAVRFRCRAGLCGAMTALLHGAANLTSAELAAAVGPFDGYETNREPMLRVMQMHRDAVEQIDDACPAYLKDAARRLWDEVLSARPPPWLPQCPGHGAGADRHDQLPDGLRHDGHRAGHRPGEVQAAGRRRHAQDRQPDGAAGAEDAGLRRAADQLDRGLHRAERHDRRRARSAAEHLPVFDCAFKPRNGTRTIAWQAHVKMMAAAQPFLSGAISKTVNMPRDTTPADIADAYLEGWRLGLKALAVYRDGSKESQPLSTSTEADKAAKQTAAVPRRERLPDTRQSITHKFNVAGHEGYITVGLYPDGRPGELFITMAKEGSTIGGLMDCFGTAVSMSLQYGVPLEVYVNKFSHTRFEPMGHTKNPDIRIAKSIVDYIFRWLGITFLPGYKEAQQGLSAEGPAAPATEEDAPGKPQPAARMAGGQASEPRPAKSDKPPGEQAAHQRRGQDERASSGANGRRAASVIGACRRRCHAAKRPVRQLPARRTQLRQLRRHHGPQRQLLSLSQLRQQYGLLVTDCRAGGPRATHFS